MNRKQRLTVVIATCVIAVAGCRLSPGNGTIYYEAKSASAVTSLRSRIEPLRTALRGNTNFTEVTGRDTLMFTGKTNGPFADCFIRFNRDEKDGAKDYRAVLVVVTARTFSVSEQVRDLRKLVEQSLGPDVVKQLTVNFDEGLIDMR
jgi:hypothetical protein